MLAAVTAVTTASSATTARRNKRRMTRARGGATPGSATRRSAPGRPGHRGAVEHGLGDEVVSDRPRLAGGSVEAVAEHGSEGREQRVAHAPVVGCAHPVADVPG